MKPNEAVADRFIQNFHNHNLVFCPEVGLQRHIYMDGSLSPSADAIFYENLLPVLNLLGNCAEIEKL